MQRLTVSLLSAAALLGGYGIARATGVRWLGGVALAALTGGATAVVARSGSPVRAGAVAAIDLVAFGGSHPLAKRLGAWPSVLAVTAVAATASALLGDEG